jgi:hypothetical protein
MDMQSRGAYPFPMFDRLVTMLAVIAITVVITLTSAHSIRMTSTTDHAGHVSGMMHAAGGDENSCEDPHGCGVLDAEMCEFICAGFAALLTLPTHESGQDSVTSRCTIPPEAGHVSRTPGLNERPLKLGLL